MRGTKAIVCLACGLFAACGKDHSLTDAGSSDANTTDAGNTIDADAHGLVSVTVMNPDGVSGPEAGVMVAFIEPNGDLAGEMATDSNGKASATVLPGASVTAVYVLSPTSHQIESILGVKPGDDLTIGSVHPDTASAGAFTANVVEIIGSTEYDVWGPCGNGYYAPPPPSQRRPLLGGFVTVPVPLTFTNDCVQSTMDLVAARYDGTGLVGVAEFRDTPFTDGGAVTATTNWVTPSTVTADFTNAPGDVVWLYPDMHVPDWNGFVSYASASVTAGAASATFTVPPAKNALVSTLITSNTHNGTQNLYEVVDGAQATYAADIGAVLLPWLDTPTIDLTTGVITVPVAGGGGAGDAFAVRYEFGRPDPNGSGSGSGALNDFYDWTVWSATSGNVTLPVLPSDLAENNPTATDFDDGGDARLFDLDLATGYDAVRAHLDSGFDAYLATGRGAIGKLRTSWSQGQPTFTRRFRYGPGSR